jgi:hypothetical protein
VKHAMVIGIAVLGAAAVHSSAIAAEVAPSKEMAERSASVSAFAATHSRAKGRLSVEDRTVLDELSAKVRRALPHPAHLPEDARRILTKAIPGLSSEEVDALAGYVTGDATQSSLFQATKQMQESQMSFNLQYLALQNQMQNENRQFTMVSNIMKTKHDTVKNSISNIR